MPLFYTENIHPRNSDIAPTDSPESYCDFIMAFEKNKNNKKKTFDYVIVSNASCINNS